ncbi:hypothetical protein, partial [Escherichia coli]|uniref:hypothetical protein n=1 Tax=Escherichia coli TaxID=562 RepID=UPI001F3A6C54
MTEDGQAKGEFIVTLRDSAGNLLGDKAIGDIHFDREAKNHKDLNIDKAFAIKSLSVDKDKAEYKYEATSYLADKYTVHVKIGDVTLTKTSEFDVASASPDKVKSTLEPGDI